METVQLQCGHCHKLMAISVEHLGGQVQCPHCQSVVQTPPRAQQAASAPVPPPQLNERDSIFGGEEATEDAIGGAGPAPTRAKESWLDTSSQPAPPEATRAEETTEEAPDPQTDLTAFKRRPIYDRSLVSIYLMIILIPYSISTTLFIGYLLMYPPRNAASLDSLPDPRPGKNQGGPRKAQLIHNLPLAANLRTPLGKSIQIGDLVVTPEHVRHAGEDLKLVLRVRNVSAQTAFEPINDFYLLYRPSKNNDPNETKPYTFLESTTKSEDPIYGGFLEYRKKSQGKEELTHTGMLRPREEEIIIITTMDNFRPDVERIVKSTDHYLWRVQVRRGFVKINDKDVSRTAVIGVEFSAQQIES